MHQGCFGGYRYRALTGEQRVRGGERHVIGELGDNIYSAGNSGSSGAGTGHIHVFNGSGVQRNNHHFITGRNRETDATALVTVEGLLIQGDASAHEAGTVVALHIEIQIHLSDWGGLVCVVSIIAGVRAVAVASAAGDQSAGEQRQRQDFEACVGVLGSTVHDVILFAQFEKWVFPKR